MSHELKVKVSRVCSDLDVDGIRGDMVTVRAAKALAAIEQRDEVCMEIRRPGGEGTHGCLNLYGGHGAWGGRGWRPAAIEQGDEVRSMAHDHDVAAT